MSHIHLRTTYDYGPDKPMPILKVGDFGSATLDLVSKSPSRKHYQGPDWPWVRRKIDVWDLGVIIHELCHGVSPIDKCPLGADERKWNSDPLKKNPKHLPAKYSRILDRNMMRCLNKDWSERISSFALAQIVPYVPTDRLTEQGWKHREARLEREREERYDKYRSRLDREEVKRRDQDPQLKYQLDLAMQHKRALGIEHEELLRSRPERESDSRRSGERRRMSHPTRDRKNGLSGTKKVVRFLPSPEYVT